MKTTLLVCTLFLALSQLSSFASETPAWGITDKEDMLKNYVDRQFLNPPATTQSAAPLAAQSQSASSSIGFAPDEITPEIEELARGLQYDALAIYNYCHNKIEYEHYWGSYKGATLTLLEGSGNCFDISSLMVALLRESGYTANYRYGVRRVADWDLEQWHCLAIYGGSDLPFDELTDAELVAEYGILPWFDVNDPNDVYDWRFMLNRLNFSVGRGYPIIDTAFGYGVAWDLPHIWVEVDDGGTVYELDPSFKLKDPVESPIDLEGATQYSRSGLLSQAGGSTTSNAVTGLSEVNIATELTTYTSNLTQWLKANRHSSSVESLMGRVRTIESFPATLAEAEIIEGSSDDYLSSKSWLTTSTVTSIPTEWMPTLSITLGLYNYSTEQFTTVGFNDDDVRLSALQGQKLSLWFNGNQTNLYLEETALASVSLSGGTVDIGLSVDHPHGYFLNDGTFVDDGNNDTSSPVVTRYVEDDTNAYAFPYGFKAGARLVRNRQNVLQAYLQNGVAESDWKVRTEMLNITGLSFMEQTELSDALVGSVFGVSDLSFHRFGRVAQEDNYYVDMFLQQAGPESFKSSATDRLNSNHVTALFNSGLEHGILEQSQAASNEALSTIKVLQLANDQGIKVFRIDSGNWDGSMETKLQNAGYSSSVIDEINDAVTNKDGIALIPNDATITLNSWTGHAYAIMKSDGNVMKINELNGGFNSTVGDFEFGFLLDNFSNEPSYLDTISGSLFYVQEPWLTPSYYGADPVDMATGAFVYDKTDLQLGQAAPRGLVFSRNYNSNRRFDDSKGLGFGWTHNLDIFLTERSAARSGLGRTIHYHAAPYLAALAAVRNLYADNATAKEWQTASLATKWAIDQLSYKGIAITMGHQTIEFIEMPDGTYAAPAGMTMTLTKNGQGRYVLSERHGNTYTFNADNRIDTITDQYSQTQSFTYSSEKLTQVQDSYGRTLTLTWSGDTISTVADGTSRDVNFSYTNGNLTTATDADDHDWTFAYDSENRITVLTDPLSRVIVQNTYDSNSRVDTQLSEGDPLKIWNLYYTGYANIEENPQGGQTKYSYDERGRSIGVENALGQGDGRGYNGQDQMTVYASPKFEFTIQRYDNENNLTEISNQLFDEAYNSYDAQNRLETATDFRGNDTVYTYNAQHQVLSVTDKKGVLIQTNTYDTLGRLETVGDADNNTTTYSYNSDGYRSRVDYPDTTFETFTYNTRGDLLSRTDRRSNTTSFTYNKRRQLLVTTFPDTSTRTAVYDSCGNLVSETDNEGSTTTYTYSSTKKPLVTTLPTTTAGTGTVTNEYDTRDWLESTTDPLTNESSYTYDAAGRIVTTTDPLNRATTQTYDVNGRVLTATNPESESTDFVYDERGKRVTQTDALSRDITYSHDKNGNQTGIQNRRLQDFTYTYDANNSQLSLETPLGNTTSQTWNDRRLLETIVEPSTQTVTFTYDSMGRVQTQTDGVGTITYGYDGNGNPTTITEGGVTITRVYDSQNRVTSYTDALGNTIGYQYDDNGNLTQLTYPDSKAVAYAYNARNQLTTVTDWNSRVTTYTYDLNGRLTGISRPNGTTRTIVYDDAGQITRLEERKADGRLLNLQDLSYDDAGRIEREFVAPIPQPFSIPTNTVTYDNDNRIATFNSLTVTHDADGNMTSAPLMADSLEAYTYDARNRLSAVDGSTYAYDSANNRTSQTDTGGTTTYAIDPNTGLSKVLIRTKPDGSKTFYVYGLGLQYEVDEAENSLTYHYDTRGSTRVLTADDGQTITDRLEYSPYGNITYREGATDTPFLFNGMFGVMTDGNGLLQMRARYFNPYLKRFINADPTGFAGGMNWYAYGAGNPIMYGDPSGNVAWLLAVPIVYWGTTQTANAPGPGDQTTNDLPFMDEAALLSGVGPTMTLGKTIVGSTVASGRSFMGTLTAQTTVKSIQSQATMKAAGTMSFQAGNSGLSLMSQAGAQATTNASRQLASKAVTYTGVYTAGSFVGGGVTGLLTPTDASNLIPSGNPLLAPFEAGSLAGSLVGNTYNAISGFFNQPVETNFK